MISFGPVPSRRLGSSLGINNILSQKICSYSCVYCQVGPTKKHSISREKFYEPEKIYTEIEKHLNKLINKPDYLTFVSNGEPTLDLNLGKSIEKLKDFGIPVAVITNASLLNDEHVRNELSLADWVSVKADANDETVWRKINRPSEEISFKKYQKSLLKFSSEYKGKLVTETMLVQGINDYPVILQQTAALIHQINPAIAYLAVPTRPPALSTVKRPDEAAINEAFHIYTEAGLSTELLLGFEGINAGCTGNAIEDIINICTVHPIREDTMTELLRKNHADPITLDLLLHGKYIKQVSYNNRNFYIRNFINQ
ncbi:MAG: radical SAM protein [Mangrovibacterium sp.]|nr:radical SAM protein [Mangrovibacterium sp.]